MRNPLRILFAAAYLLLVTCVNPAYATPPIITNIFMVPRLTIQSDIGITNQIQFSTNLSQSNWFVITNLVVSHSPYTFVDSTISNGIQRFYRVLAFYPPPTPATLNVTGFTSPKVAGVAGTFTVSAKDSNNAVVTGYTGTVHFASSDPAAVLPANYAFTPGDAGVHTFSASLATTGVQSLTAADTVNNSLIGTQSGILVTPAAAANLGVSGFPSPQPAGVSGIITVQARDAFGNLTVGYSGTVHFSSSDPQAILPVNSTLQSGSKTFSATLKSAGLQSITGTDTVNTSINGSQSGITVSSGMASAVAVSSGNNQVGVAGAQLVQQLAVKITDSGGNAVAGTTVNWAATAGGTGVSVGSSSSITDASGIATTSATLGSSGGVNTFTATVTGLTGSPVTFNATAAKNVVLNSGNNQTASAGHSLSVPLVIKVTDNASNPVSGIQVNWSVILGGTGATVSSSSTFTDASGLAQVTATLGNVAGANSFRATVTGLTGSPVTFNATGL